MFNAMARVDRGAMGFTPIAREADIRLEWGRHRRYDAMLHVYGKTSRTIAFKHRQRMSGSESRRSSKVPENTGLSTVRSRNTSRSRMTACQSQDLQSTPSLSTTGARSLSSRSRGAYHWMSFDLGSGNGVTTDVTPKRVGDQVEGTRAVGNADGRRHNALG